MSNVGQSLCASQFPQKSDGLGKWSMFRIVGRGGGGGLGGGRKGGGRHRGGGRRGGEERDSQDGGKQEKKGKNTQHCAIFRNRKNAKRREPTNTGREPGL